VICWNDKLALYHLKCNGLLAQLPSIIETRKELDNSIHTFTRKMISIVTLYDRVFLAIIDPKKSEQPSLFLYRLARNCVKLDAEYSIGQGSEFSLNVCDNCILVHNFFERVSLKVLMALD
jgi:hypothetical protein